MDSQVFVFMLILCIATSCYSQTYNVNDFGAVGNGIADDSKAFLRTWEAACGANSKLSNMFIPQGKKYLLYPTLFKGPCKATSVVFTIQGTLVAPSEVSNWQGYDPKIWLGFVDINGLVVDGIGEIDGQGQEWWKKCPVLSEQCERPTAMSFGACTNLNVQRLQSSNSARNHISISSCTNAIFQRLQLVAPADSPNTDGIDISHSSHIRILDSSIGTGDDCIAINSGTSNVTIDGLICGPGHGISIGSLGRDGEKAEVENIWVNNCTLKSTQNGVRIKTWQGGSGYATRISFQDITFIDAGNPVLIDQFYCPHGSCSDKDSNVEVSQVSYNRLQGTTISERAISLNCSSTLACKQIHMNHINIRSSKPKTVPGTICNNVQGTFEDVIPTLSCSFHNFGAK
ncbi:hypothetical protein ACFE04_028840 [Oxalis oulophora]